MKTITMKLPQTLDEKILKFCKKFGLSRSEFIRSAITKELQRAELTFFNSEERLREMILKILKEEKGGTYEEIETSNI